MSVTIVPLVTSKEIDVMMRILVKHIPGISHLSSMVLQHIHHPYSVAMSKKSEVVCLYIN